MLERRNVSRVLAGKCKAGELLGRRGRRCEDHMKMRLKEVQLDVVHWIYLAAERELC